MDSYFFKWFKVYFIHICNKLLALGNWIRHNLKDKLRNHINNTLNAEKMIKHLIIRSFVIIDIYCDHHWVIVVIVIAVIWWLISYNFHDNVLYCMLMLVLVLSPDCAKSAIRLEKSDSFFFGY